MPNVFIPQLLVGINVQLLGLTALIAAADGSLAYGTEFDLASFGTLDAFRYEARNLGPDIRPVNAFVENYVPTVEAFTVMVGEIETAEGDSYLMEHWHNFNYMRVAGLAVAPGVGGGAGNYFAAILTRGGGNIGKGYVEDKNAVVATYMPCSIPVYWGPQSQCPI